MTDLTFYKMGEITIYEVAHTATMPGTQQVINKYKLLCDMVWLATCSRMCVFPLLYCSFYIIFFALLPCLIFLPYPFVFQRGLPILSETQLWNKRKRTTAKSASGFTKYLSFTSSYLKASKTPIQGIISSVFLSD